MEDNTITFESLGLSEKLLNAIEKAGYEKPSPIQEKAIPLILSHRDIFGCAQTGTGKTAAFALPIMQMIENSGTIPHPKQFRALILTPTRELAEQISTNIAVYGKGLDISHCKVYGGVSQNPQVRALSVGVDILVATPGRLLDLHNQKFLDFSAVEYLVLDEADRMLDMGFIQDIKKICKLLPKGRQSLLFSATLSSEIEVLAKSIVTKPEKISISPDKPTVDKIMQRVAYLDTAEKFNLLETVIKERLIKDPKALSLIFTRTKHGANKLAKRLTSIGIEADAIHGNKSQGARQNALNRFKKRESKILVATDIAARGIDVKDMTLVINYDLPEDPETYVHRIGRTARAEADGEAISFCGMNEAPLLKSIEKFIKKEIDTFYNNPYHSDSIFNAATKTRSIIAKAKKLTEIALAPTKPSKGPRGYDGRRANSGKSNNRNGRGDKGGKNRGGRNESFSRTSKSQKSEAPQRQSKAKSRTKIGSVLSKKIKQAKSVAKSSASPKSGFWQKLKKITKR